MSRSASSFLLDETAYDFVNDLNETVILARGGMSCKNTSIEFKWDTTGGTPLSGFDGVVKIYITNVENDEPLVEATQKLFPTGIPIDVDKGSKMVVLDDIMHKSIRFEYLHNSNAGIGTFKITTKSEIL